MPKCVECDQMILNENINCYKCCKIKSIPLSGNKVVDNFIRYTLINDNKSEIKLEFVPYDKFNDVKFIGEGGFSKIYSATWDDGPITNWNYEKRKYDRYGKITIALKELNNSKNINSKELNEV
jgi:hypothetical protein